MPVWPCRRRDRGDRGTAAVQVWHFPGVGPARVLQPAQE